MNKRTLAPGIDVSGQPSLADIKQLHDDGFATVVNVRTAEEEGFLKEEERTVEDTGMTYAAIPISPTEIDDASVARFLQSLESVHAKPALVHCGGGGRAGMMVLIYMAIENGWSLEEALEEGEKLGISPSTSSPYRAFFEDYIKRHSSGMRLEV